MDDAAFLRGVKKYKNHEKNLSDLVSAYRRHATELYERPAVKAQREIREQRGGIDDRGALVEVRAPKDRVYKNAKEAAQDLSFSRKFLAGAPLIQQGMDPDLAAHIVQRPEPITEPGLVDDRGNRLEPIGRKLEPEDRQLTLREAARYTGNARELDALAAEQQWVSNGRPKSGKRQRQRISGPSNNSGSRDRNGHSRKSNSRRLSPSSTRRLPGSFRGSLTSLARCRSSVKF